MPTLVLLWVWLCAYLNCAGWALSAIRELNPGGYAVALAVWAATVFAGRKYFFAPLPASLRRHKFSRRFRRAFPLAFLVLAAMEILGGIIYPPTNYDALAYRLPRILHWLATDQWHWIHTFFDRVNTRSCGIEWVSAPVIALLKTDRPLFLINVISFLFLPGLVFSVFTRLGVRPRVAWHWMWIVPTGYCFLVQAGSIGNDLFGAPFALASVDFALRARETGWKRYFYGSILAAAMMTSAKTSSLPLMLPWAIAVLPSWRMLRHPVGTAAICLFAIFASALPTMYWNQKYYHHWQGADIPPVGVGGELFRAGANVAVLTVQNFVPPVFPAANAWNREEPRLMPPALNARMHQVMFEPSAVSLGLQQMQTEENAGLGFGVSLLLLLSFIAACRHRRKSSPKEPAGRALLRWSPAISLAALMTQYGLAVFCRIITPYYALLMPILLAGSGQDRVVGKRWWRAAAFAVFLLAALLAVVSPPRPLFPAQWLVRQCHADQSHRKWARRVAEVYTVYANRADAFAPVREALPKDLKILGMTSADDPEPSLWQPFGSRRIEYVCPEDSAQNLKSRGIEYVLLKGQAFGPGHFFPEPVESWIKSMNGQIIEKFSLNLRAASGPADWYLVKLD